MTRRDYGIAAAMAAGVVVFAWLAGGIGAPDPIPVQPTIRDYVACAEEDGSGSTFPCRWDARVQGNGRGDSFTMPEPGVFVYDDGRVAYDDTATADPANEDE